MAVYLFFFSFFFFWPFFLFFFMDTGSGEDHTGSGFSSGLEGFWVPGTNSGLGAFFLPA